MTENVQHKMATGAVWMVLFKLMERGLGLISTLVLVRLLMPEDFGIVAMAMTFITMAEMLTAFGFDLAIIQNKDATEQHYSTGWTGNLLIGASICLVMLLCAQPISQFFGRDELIWAVSALALGPMLGSLENIGIVAFRKELAFRREFIFQVSKKLVSVAIVIPLALLWRNYWALVVGTLLARVYGVILSYVMHPFRPRLTLEKFGEMYRFSRWLLFNNAIAFFKERSTDFFVGRRLGPAALGLYNISYELANLPTTELSAPINRALLPGFAKLGSVGEVAVAYSNAIGMLSLIALPAAAGIFAIAEYLVPVLLGDKWLGATQLLEVLAFNGALLLFHSSICAILIGRGYPKVVAMTNGAYVLILLLLLWWLTACYGVQGATYSVLGASLLATPIYLHQMKRCLGIGPMTFVSALVRPLAASTLMALAIRGLLPEFDSTSDFPFMTGWLAAGVVAGGGVYCLAIALLWMATGRKEGPEKILWQRGRELVLERVCRRWHCQ